MQFSSTNKTIQGIILKVFGLIFIIALSFFLFALGTQAYDTPAGFDWRDKDNENWVTPVKNQACGSCWAFSAIGTVETYMNIQNNDPGLNLDLSEQYLVSDCFGFGTCIGGSSLEALTFIQQEGVPGEDCYPFTGLDSSCSERCDNWQDELIKIPHITQLGDSIEAINKHIAETGPVSIGINMVGVFNEDNLYVCDGSSGSNWHRVVAVGYQDDVQEGDGYWIMKNSWGNSWGPDHDGYFKVPYLQCGSGDAIGISNNISCGSRLPEKETVLDADLLNCPKNGLDFYTDDATLDCNGHVISHLEQEHGFSQGVTVFGNGVSNTDNATIKNCSIQGFDRGISVSGSLGNNITNNILTDNKVGIYIGFSTSSKIWDNYFNSIITNYDLSGYNENIWDVDQLGNEWSDFSNNIGFPYIYKISSTNVDHYPIGGMSQIPTQIYPLDHYLFVLGIKMNFSWQPAPETNPTRYWFRVYRPDGSLLLPNENGFVVYSTGGSILSDTIETIIYDGIWEWQIGAEIDSYIYWGSTRNVIKKTAADLLSPNVDAEVHVGELFDWKDVSGANNYIARIVGLLPDNKPHYMPLNSDQSKFSLDTDFFDKLKTGIIYKWSIAGTALGKNLSSIDPRLPKLSYGVPRSFIKE